MDSYHTREAFEARQTARQADPTPVAPHAVFYHAALMPGWEPIVAEQMAVCGAAGLTELHSFVLAPRPADVARLAAVARHYGVVLHVLGTDRRVDRYEVPTLAAAWAWAVAHPAGAVTYFHTKGASNPLDAHKRQWRRVMGRVNLAEWRTNLALLETHDIVGAAWSHLPDFPHYAGNFWAARCDWLAHLPSPEEYRRARLVDHWAGHPWDRMCAELWLGSRPWHAMFDRLAHGSGRIHTNDAFGYPSEVPGVDYAGEFFLAPAGPGPAAPPRLSVIVPTARIDAVGRAVATVTAELEPGDEVIVKCDASADYGATPRNAAAAQAAGTHLLFLDDDDAFLPGWAAAVRGRIRAHPDVPLVFRMRLPDGRVLWREPELAVGNVGTPMIVVPNVKGKLGRWSTRYECDYDFLAGTAAHYPAGAVAWCPEVIAAVRPRPEGGTCTS